jgi:crotonobetainyl-CoA:carnitine CoA-transferase CaiB-like acyl-CoA transferase
MISLGVVQQRQFETLCRFLDKLEWLEDPRFLTPDARREQSAELHKLLEAVIRTKPAAHWESSMSAVGIPCGMVREVGEAAEFGHLEDRGLRLPLGNPGLPGGENVDIVKAGFVMKEDGPTVDVAPPRLNEHREQILRWLDASRPQSSKGRRTRG